ncbi:type I secretion system permease/ATPase [Halodesulfovibrio sp.]|jgi:subfamily B ATP-binding cassette protein HlyB/CyaB|uniref:peptidase domain-containing ABC transporter n=1 Tax=Halodesulfovibrio sp. TaxID=1912772 RepID=UPI0025FDC300|nr:type I secretion system permease/ATPase [Halodesulfovibrio sp.]MCT4625809.1 type I secretion system permease/ATPase [Halodesulfovibrio sp.]
MNSGLVSLEVVARINKVRIDIANIVREHCISSDDISSDELVRIAKRLGLRAKKKNLPLDKCHKKYPYPIIAQSKDDRFFVVLGYKEQEETVLIYIPEEGATRSVPLEEFNELTTDRYIILSHRLLSESVRFGLGWFFKEVFNAKGIMAEILLASFVVQLFGLVTPLFTQVILDKVLVHRAMTTLKILAIGFIVIAVFEYILNLARNYLFTHTANKIDAKLGAQLFRHLLSLPCPYFEARKVGDTIARVRELENIRSFVTNKTVSVLIDLVFSIVFVVVMLMYSVQLTFIVIGFVALIGLLYLCITPELRRRLNTKFEMGAKSNSYLVESVTGIQTVKSLAIEGSIQRKWEDHLGRYVFSNFKMTNMSNITRGTAGFLQKLMTISILYLGVKLVLNSELTIGQLIAFNMLSGQFSGPVLRLIGVWNELQQTLISVDKLSDILNHPSEVQSENAIVLNKLEGNVVFENVQFKYAPDAPMVLKGINLNIPPGSCVGIVGRSGSGKSTVSKLIQRLYIPSAGSVRIDDVDINHVSPVWLRSNIGVVLQENYLFSGTIKENIVMGAPNASMDLVLHVSKITGVHDFVSRLPKGYDSEVGERGEGLSGGQRQRIAIARALITDPRILIFDEATSALDIESELIIRRNLQNIARGRTMFIIAHKISIVKNCSVILAMDNGELIEAGTHDELMRIPNGYYKKLYTLQECTQ